MFHYLYHLALPFIDLTIAKQYFFHSIIHWKEHKLNQNWIFKFQLEHCFSECILRVYNFWNKLFYSKIMKSTEKFWIFITFCAHQNYLCYKIQFYGHVFEFSPVSIKECLCLFFYALQNVKNYEKLIKLCTHQIILNMCDGDGNGENSTES